jgi:hypothetical protein
VPEGRGADAGSALSGGLEVGDQGIHLGDLLALALDDPVGQRPHARVGEARARAGRDGDRMGGIIARM